MKSGYVAIIGEPNVGKSTLLNRLIRTKLSPVSKKPQTTRNRIMGILTEKDYQCCFLDTPGIITPQYPLQEHMVNQIKSAVADADVIVWMTDPWFNSTKFPRHYLRAVTRVPVIAVINKIDLADKPRLESAVKAIQRERITTIIPISALAGTHVTRLKAAILKLLPQNPYFYPTEDISDQPTRFFIAEIIREKIFYHFRKEIPYSTCVAIEEYKERTAGKDLIRAVIYVERDSQKGILIGNRGRALKNIGQLARAAIEAFVERPVYLELWVKVKEKWRKDKKFLKEIGY